MKLLVIEDEHRIATYIKKGLEMKSHVVDLAYDGEAGYDLASSEKYDVIILDRMLPKLDGVAVILKLREENNHVPILLLTAKTDVEDRVEGLEAGADDYLGKPFAFTELLARVRALGRRPKARESSIITIADLTIDTSNFQVSRAKQPINLSKKEFTLLEFLARHHGQVLTIDQITQQVWEYDSDVLPNTAQVYIGYLRKKIDQPFKSAPLIKTVRGFGYQFGEK
jgi:two-component system OmpR family response regulator